VIIFGSVWFLLKKVTKPIFFQKNKPKPVQTDWFWFGYFRTKTSFSVWLGFSGLTLFFSGFFYLGLVRFF
jgi:hypothetical protein